MTCLNWEKTGKVSLSKHANISTKLANHHAHGVKVVSRTTPAVKMKEKCNHQHILYDIFKCNLVCFVLYYGLKNSKFDSINR